MKCTFTQYASDEKDNEELVAESYSHHFKNEDESVAEFWKEVSSRLQKETSALYHQ